MGVITQSEIISGATKAANKGIENQLAEINKKLDKILEIKQSDIDDVDFEIHSRNKMVWWTELPNAASYRLRLYLEGHEIDVIETTRSKRYHTFNDLVGDGYYIVLEVEDRNGKIIRDISITI